MAPYALNLSFPSLARRFVSRQLALMRQGLGKERAFQTVEAEMHRELGALKWVGLGGWGGA